MTSDATSSRASIGSQRISLCERRSGASLRLAGSSHERRVRCQDVGTRGQRSAHRSQVPQTDNAIGMSKRCASVGLEAHDTSQNSHFFLQKHLFTLFFFYFYFCLYLYQRTVDFSLRVLCLCVLHDWCLALASARCVSGPCISCFLLFVLVTA